MSDPVKPETDPMTVAELIRRMTVIVAVATLTSWLAQHGQFFLYQGF